MTAIDDPIDGMAYQVMQVLMQLKGYQKADLKEYWTILLAAAALGDKKAQQTLEGFRAKVRQADSKVAIEGGA